MQTGGGRDKKKKKKRRKRWAMPRSPSTMGGEQAKNRAKRKSMQRGGMEGETAVKAVGAVRALGTTWTEGSTSVVAMPA